MLLTALLFNTLTGVVCASVLGFSPVAGAVGMNAVAAFMGMAPQSTSILREGVYTEIWTGELVKVLRAGLEGTWLSGIPDQSSIVNNDVIHLVEVGVDPDVLINNKTYPIDVQALEDKDIAIKLDKFQTKATPITDDELYAISYDKTARVKEGHANSIMMRSLPRRPMRFVRTKIRKLLRCLRLPARKIRLQTVCALP